MNNRQLFARSLVLCTPFAILAQLAFPVSAQRSLSIPASRIDVVRRNYTAVPEDPEAVYEGARIVHNVTVNGEKGMQVHAKFRVRYGLNTPCMLIAYFYYEDAENTPLKTDDPEYRDKKGGVATRVNFTPAYDPAVYEDLQLFMPYKALNMESGQTYQLKFYLALYDKEGGRFFGKSGWYKFNLTMP
ncbi:MAG TPA: hypothetical protein VN951_01355 [Pyrinomonadaceae bacterium]|nr:hypothetical protein [Pyrinomonadaceae bacterium]